jgi:glycosyltransferase involved in cell wall biosynthesis
MKICIPTYRRIERQTTLENLPESWLNETLLITNKNETERYFEKYGDRVKVEGIDVVGISATRQWVMENISAKYILFLDDDMEFHKRENEKLIKADNEDVAIMLNKIEYFLKDGYAHVGVSARQGNNHVIDDFDTVTRMNNAYAFEVEVFKKENIRFDRLEVMEDFDVTLQLLKLGYPNIVIYKYAWGQRKSGDKGGCSEYRTAKMQRKAAFELSKLHPGLVTVVGKKSQTTWGNIGNIRTDVKISWKKAFKQTTRNKEGITNFL